MQMKTTLDVPSYYKYLFIYVLPKQTRGRQYIQKKSIQCVKMKTDKYVINFNSLQISRPPNITAHKFTQLENLLKKSPVLLKRFQTRPLTLRSSLVCKSIAALLWMSQWQKGLALTCSQASSKWSLPGFTGTWWEIRMSYINHPDDSTCWYSAMLGPLQGLEIQACGVLLADPEPGSWAAWKMPGCSSSTIKLQPSCQVWDKWGMRYWGSWWPGG